MRATRRAVVCTALLAARLLAVAAICGDLASEYDEVQGSCESSTLCDTMVASPACGASEALCCTFVPAFDDTTGVSSYECIESCEPGAVDYDYIDYGDYADGTSSSDGALGPSFAVV